MPTPPVSSPHEKAARDLLAGDHDFLISVASLWEIVIKTSIGKLRLGGPVEEAFPDIAEQLDASILPIELEHLYAVDRLPLHHRDPFDRLLIAQSIVEGVPILTQDPQFGSYAAATIW